MFSKKSIVFFSLIVLSLAQSPTFTIPVLVNDPANKNIDTDGSKTIAVFNENVYTVWIDWDDYNICFSKSDDRGETFSNAKHPSSIIDTTKAQLFPAITVDKYGTIFIIWTIIGEEFITNSGIFMTRSTDGGESFEKARNVVSMPSVYCSIATYEDNVYLFYPSSDNYPFGEYFFQRSIDNGDNFSDPVQVTDEACQDSLKFDSMTDMLVDKDGVIHLVWNDARRAEGNSDIYYCKSTDEGQSFSTNIPVNNLTYANANILHWDPSIGVKQNGDVYVVWRYHSDFRNAENWDYENLIAIKYHDADAFTNQYQFNAGFLHCSSPSIAINQYDQMYIFFSARETSLFCYSQNSANDNFISQIIGDGHNATSYASVVIDNENKACVFWTSFYNGNSENPTDEKNYGSQEAGMILLSALMKKLNRQVHLIYIRTIQILSILQQRFLIKSQ